MKKKGYSDCEGKSEDAALLVEREAGGGNGNDFRGVEKIIRQN